MAAATFVLALKTRTMAKETADVAKASKREAEAVEQQTAKIEEQVRISTEALRSSMQPWLAWEPTFEVEKLGTPVGLKGNIYIPGVHPCIEVSQRSDGSIEGWLRVKNVGNGLALLDLAHAVLFRQNDMELQRGVHISVSSPIVAPRESIDVAFEFSGSPAERARGLEYLVGVAADQVFGIQVPYSDAGGRSEATARFLVHRKGAEGDWSVDEVTYSIQGGITVTTTRSTLRKGSVSML
jgi:hypothetical protein